MGATGTKPNCRNMILRTLMCKPSACSNLHLQSFQFSTTASQLLLKKPQGKVKLTNNLFKADAIKKVWQCLCKISLSMLFSQLTKEDGIASDFRLVYREASSFQTHKIVQVVKKAWL